MVRGRAAAALFVEPVTMRMSESANALVRAALPGALILAASAAVAYSGLGRAKLPDLLAVAAPGVLALGLFLGWRFHRAKAVFVLLALALAGWALWLAEARGPMGDRIFGMVAFLLPLNLAIYPLLPERGFFNAAGARRLGALLAQSLAVLALALWGGRAVTSLVEYRFSSAPVFAAVGIPQPALAAFLVALVALSVGLAVRRSVLEAGFLWTLLAAFVALDPGGPGPLATLYLTAGGLIVALSVLEVSHTLAYRDELTALPGRRALNEALAALGGRYAIAMADVDHFKRFNDRYGHDAGDQVLRMVAARLGEAGGGAKVFRFGGEEFALVFPGSTAGDAMPHLEGLRSAVAASPFTLRRPGRPQRRPDNPTGSGGALRVKVTISLGVADAGGVKGGPQEVLRAADRALYRAKDEGRNRVRR